MSEPQDPLKLKTLGNYRWPNMPADESLKRFTWKIWKRFRKEDGDPFISDASLRWANNQRLDAVAAPPAYGSVLREMQATFREWVDDPQPARWLQLIVLPPCDCNDSVRAWAKQHGHRIVEPPTRETLLDASSCVSVPFDCDEGVLVIPRLERWFLRHHDGLAHVRRLLEAAAEAKRHCILGCNSWAWQFLSKSIGAGLLLPHGLTINALDADRLHDWFSELANSGSEKRRRFRFSSSGKDVFPNGSTHREPSNYFQRLAATSLGIPWIAWHLWRRSLRFSPDENDQDDDRDDNQDFNKADPTTMWVAPLEELELPSDEVDVALLTLHALLIHDGLTRRELDLATPSVDASNVLPSLVAADFVARDGDRYHCTASGYPVVHSKLKDAGFPMDKL